MEYVIRNLLTPKYKLSFKKRNYNNLNKLFIYIFSLPPSYQLRQLFEVRIDVIIKTDK